MREKQLEKVGIDWSRQLSKVRIHVKIIIGVVKQKYIHKLTKYITHFFKLMMVLIPMDNNYSSSLLCSC